MKFSNINKRFTEVVADYIQRGYTINAGTMIGSQGEIARIDLTDGTNIIRVLVQNESNFRELDFVQILVGKCTNNVKINSDDMWDTIWNDNLEVISCEKFYKIGEDRKNGTEYGTKEEAEKAKEKHCSRYDRSNRQIDLTEKYIEIAKKIAKRVWNKKKVRNDDVKLFRRDNSYYVSYRCKCYNLH